MPVSLAEASECTSPTTWSGSRTLARITSIRSRLSRPRSASFMIGMNSPSSYISEASGPKPRPPMSTTWAVEPK